MRSAWDGEEYADENLIAAAWIADVSLDDERMNALLDGFCIVGVCRLRVRITYKSIQMFAIH